METVPTVDLQSTDIKELSDEEQVRVVGRRMFKELKEHGFVYLRNSGLSESLRQSAFQSARAFFALPLETKLKYDCFGDPYASGYTPRGGEILSRSEIDCDILELKEIWDTYNFDSNLPKEDAPDFSRDVVALNATFEALMLRVLPGLEEAMGRPGVLTNSHRDQHGNWNSNQRAAYYPALPEAVPAGAVRCATHSDFGSMTFLTQEDCGGLDVLNRSGNWVPAPALPGAILLIIGDMLELLTGGELMATKHRVLVPEEEELRKIDRLSFGFFYAPRNDELLEPPPNSEGYQPTHFGEYLQQKFQAVSSAHRQRMAQK